MDIIPDLIGKVSEAQLKRSVFHLSQNPLPFRKANYTVPGHAKSTLDEADDWIEEQLKSRGYPVEREACRVQAFGFDPSKPKHHTYAPPAPGAPFYTVHNLYAEKRGASRPDEIILLLAHKDSQSWTDCPGAYDNAVGTAAVMEIARALSDYPNRKTIRYLFCNEEHTPWTSVTAARNARERGDDLVAIYNLDGLGGKSDADHVSGRKPAFTLYTEPEGKPFADLMAEVNDFYRIGLEQSSLQRPQPGDDDGSFVNAGYKHAVINIGSFPYGDSEYHLAGDVPERVDFANVRMAAQATLAAVVRVDQNV
ncbi:MAG: M28 family peptidase [Armatimonadetes bacterium]|nr:M28 family peptidase [Armatimonadota bacterium]